jgi:hypothetical protein
MNVKFNKNQREHKEEKYSMHLGRKINVMDVVVLNFF